MNGQKIFSLAMLDTDLREKRVNEPIEYFEKWVLYVFRRKNLPIASTSKVQDGLMEIFGIEIPQAVIERIFKKLKKKSFLNQDNRGVWIINQKKLKEINFKPIEKARSEFQRMFSNLINNFVIFVQDRFKDKNFDRKKAEKLIINYLDNKSVAILKHLTTGTIPAEKTESRQYSYYLATFLSYVLQNDPSNSEYLEKLIKGHLLQAYLFYTANNPPSQKFTQLDIYLDTPILLSLLGYKGPESQQYAKELLTLLRDEGGHLKVFIETLREVERILLACKFGLEYPYASKETLSFDVLREFIKRKATSIDVRREIETLNEKIKLEKIEIEKFPPHSRRYEPDETALEKLLKDIVRYRNEDALRHDTSCISAIYRLRKGSSTTLIENSGAIFLTTNTKVIKAANRWYREIEKKKGIPPAISSEALAAIAWVKQPLKAPNLPKLAVIADCYEMLNPPDDIWYKYIKAIDELQKKGEISDEEVFLLKYSAEAHHALMEKTFGDSARLTVGTIPDILEKAKSELLKKERDRTSQIQRELEKIKNEQNKERKMMEEKIKKEREEKLKIEKEIKEIKKRRFNDFYYLGFAIGIFLIIIVTLITRYLLDKKTSIPGWLSFLILIFTVIEEIMPKLQIVKKFATWFARKTTGYDFESK